MSGNSGATWREIVTTQAGRLAVAGVPSPEHDARLLAEHVVGAPIGRAPDPTAESIARFRDLITRRAERIPLQHLTGETGFRHLLISCRPGVFVPRPETEIVAGIAIDAAMARGDEPVVVEPCTGTGAIALAVATEVAGAQVFASDVAPDAVDLAKLNAERVARGDAGVAGFAPGAAVSVAQASLLDSVPAELRGAVDVLVSNPPYLPASDRDGWPPEVADHDPAEALVGGPDGYEVVGRLLHLAADWLAPGGVVVLEIDERRGDEAVSRAEAAGLVDVHTRNDLTGVVRAVCARRPPADANLNRSDTRRQL